MKLTAACSSAIRADLHGPQRRALLLGVVDTALYLRIPGHDARVGVVVAVVAADAVRLPCALSLGTTSRDLPLTELRPVDGGAVTVGSERLGWTCAHGPVTVAIAREWAPARPGAVSPRPDRVAALRAHTSALPHGVVEPALAALARAGRDPGSATPAVAGLLGSGPGLTPSGDDVLAGFVLAAGAFALDITDVRAAITASATTTTDLSAQLLGHALRGECIPELSAVVRAIGGSGPLGPALDRLLRVGHTSGAALAAGVAIAAAAAVAVPAASGATA